MIGNRDNRPVIIFGMHRSGTTIVGNILQAHGLFSGARQDENGESVLFQDLNNWMFRASGASWDNPRAITNLLRDSETQELTNTYLARILSGPQQGRYWGWSAFLGHVAAPRRGVETWGWKDPRNTFTLPIWERLFPEARYVYVERHGIDVAHSLVARRRKEMDGYRKRFNRYPFIYGLRMKKGGFSDSMRSTTIEHALEIWEEYVAEGRAHVTRLGPGRVECVNFEDLCTNPVDTVGKLLRFLELGDAATVQKSAIDRLKPERAFAFRNDPKLSYLAKMFADRLRQPAIEPIHLPASAVAN